MLYLPYCLTTDQKEALLRQEEVRLRSVRESLAQAEAGLKDREQHLRAKEIALADAIEAVEQRQGCLAAAVEVGVEHCDRVMEEGTSGGHEVITAKSEPGDEGGGEQPLLASTPKKNNTPKKAVSKKQATGVEKKGKKGVLGPRAKTAWQFWLDENRTRLMETVGGHDYMRVGGEEWSGIEDKSKWVRMAEKEKTIFALRRNRPDVGSTRGAEEGAGNE